MNKEKDPFGRDQHKSGSKLDLGKNRAGLVLFGFARALWAVSEVGTFGASKYSDNGWMDVPNGYNRYTDALTRHLIQEAMGEEVDPDSGLLHAAHLAWNALARLELAIREHARVHVVRNSFNPGETYREIFEESIKNMSHQNKRLQCDQIPRDHDLDDPRLMAARKWRKRRGEHDQTNHNQ